MGTTVSGAFPSHDRRGQRLLGAAGIVLTAGLFAVTAGWLGAAVGIGLVAAWTRLSVPAVVALAHLGLVGLFPDGVAAEALLLVEFGVLLVFIAPFVQRPVSSPEIAVAAVTPVALGSLALGIVHWSGSPLAAAVTLGVVASLAAYGLHRYELLRLGLVES